MIETVETEVVQDLAPTIVDSVERAAIDSQVATARKYGRSLSKVKSEMLSFATLDEETAASCFYTLPRGGKTIQGPSVRLAEIAVACYEHLRVETTIVATDTGKDNPHVVVRSRAYDCLKNSAISIEKRRRILPKNLYDSNKRVIGKKPIDDDDINLATNSCSATAFRDAVFKVVPRALITPVYEAAKKVAVGDVKSLGAKRQQVVDRLKQMGANERSILAVVEANKVEDITLEKLETLIGLGTALKDGAITLEEAFPAPKIEPVAFVKKTAPAAPPEPPKATPAVAAAEEDGEPPWAKVQRLVEDEWQCPWTVFHPKIVKSNLFPGSKDWQTWESIPAKDADKMIANQAGIKTQLGLTDD